MRFTKRIILLYPRINPVPELVSPNKLSRLSIKKDFSSSVLKKPSGREAIALLSR